MGALASNRDAPYLFVKRGRRTALALILFFRRASGSGRGARPNPEEPDL